MVPMAILTTIFYQRRIDDFEREPQSNLDNLEYPSDPISTSRRRYVIAYNPQQAELDPINREQILERLSCELEVLNQKKKTKAQCKVMLHRSMGRMSKSSIAVS
jgi:hypothetical protein